MAALNLEVAEAIVVVAAVFDPLMLPVGQSGYRLVEAGHTAGLGVLNEAFAERCYPSDGQLVSRETVGVLPKAPIMAARHARALARDEPVATLAGESPLTRFAGTATRPTQWKSQMPSTPSSIADNSAQIPLIC